LSEAVESQDVRAALIETLDSEYSTSVVLESMDALEDYVDEDAGVRNGFIRVMQDDDMSSTARVRAGEALVEDADARLKNQIAEAMEDVIIQLSRRGRWHGHGDLIEEAFEVLEDADPDRAERLEARYRKENW
jgi:hypothetical protein